MRRNFFLPSFFFGSTSDNLTSQWYKQKQDLCFQVWKLVFNFLIVFWHNLTLYCVAQTERRILLPILEKQSLFIKTGYLKMYKKSWIVKGGMRSCTFRSCCFQNIYYYGGSKRYSFLRSKNVSISCSVSEFFCKIVLVNVSHVWYTVVNCLE